MIGQETVYMIPAVGRPIVTAHMELEPLLPFQVRIRNEAVAINPVDWKVQDGAFARLYPKPWPKVLGVDSAGVVVEVGNEVDSIKVGDRIAGYTRMNKGPMIGAFKEYSTVWADMSIKLPSTMSTAAGATFPLAYATATVGLNLDLGVPLPLSSSGDETDGILKSEPFLVLGGSSSIGQFVIQLLKLSGYTKVLSTASRQHHAMLRTLGASDVFDYHDESLRDEILQATQQVKIKYVFDAITDASSVALTTMVADLDEGRIVQTGDIPIPGATFCKATFGGRIFDATSTAPWDGQNPQEYEFGRRSIQCLQELVDGGLIRPTPVTIVTSESVAQSLNQALDACRKGLSGQKAVVIF